MKKTVLLLAMLFVAALANADSLDKLARRYMKYDGVVYAASLKEIDKLSDDKDTKIIIKRGDKEQDSIEEFVNKMREVGVKDMRVLQLRKCTQDVKRRFADDARKSLPRAYESFLRLSDDEEGCSIYLDKDKRSMKILILYAGSDSCGFVEIDSDNDILNSLLNFD